MQAKSRKRRATVDPVEGSLIEQLQLGEFKELFPEEVKQICELAPVRLRPEIADDLLFRLSEIVHFERIRAKPEYVENIRVIVKTATEVADKVQEIAERTCKLDVEHLLTFWSIAEQLSPYFEGKTADDVFQGLVDLRILLSAVGVAAQFATATSIASSKGRPHSPYIRAAMALIDAWESATAEQLQEDSPLWLMKRVPTPKRLDEKGSNKVLNTKQPSTEFVWISLRLINPRIKEAEVFTAIKGALKVRDEFYEFVRSKPPTAIHQRLEKFFKFRELKKAAESTKRKRAPNSHLHS
jgi:hypothetical protein